MDYKIVNGPTISAVGVVEESIFDRYDDPNKPGFYWFVKADVPNKAEYIFYGSPNTQKSEGMAGRIVPFKCTDGQTIMVQGPWWTNSDSFYKSTGIDVRNTVETFVVIARTLDHVEGQAILKDVVYKDDEPTIGSFDRWRTVARDVFLSIPDDVLAIYCSSKGGSSYGYYNRSDFI